MQITLTDEMILAEIESYKARIRAVQARLSGLPVGYLPFKEHKKREKERRSLQAEFQHVQKLMGYAAEALKECVQELQLIES